MSSNTRQYNTMQIVLIVNQDANQDVNQDARKSI
jgi:hypothetical protein